MQGQRLIEYISHSRKKRIACKVVDMLHNCNKLFCTQSDYILNRNLKKRKFGCGNVCMFVFPIYNGG